MSFEYLICHYSTCIGGGVGWVVNNKESRNVTFSQKPVGDSQSGARWGEDAPSLKPTCPLLCACQAIKIRKKRPRYMHKQSEQLHQPHVYRNKEEFLRGSG